MRSTTIVTGGSALEAIGGAGAAVLAIAALSGVRPLHAAPIAASCAGGALFAHGAALMARWRDTVARVHLNQRVELAGGITSEVLGGAAAIVLGILAHSHPGLLPVAAVVLGGSLLLAAPSQPAGGTMLLGGAASVVLGVLALAHDGPAVRLSVIAMLAVGGALVLSGTAMTGRIVHDLPARIRRYGHA